MPFVENALLNGHWYLGTLPFKSQRTGEKKREEEKCEVKKCIVKSICTRAARTAHIQLAFVTVTYYCWNCLIIFYNIIVVVVSNLLHFDICRFL